MPTFAGPWGETTIFAVYHCVGDQIGRDLYRFRSQPDGAILREVRHSAPGRREEIDAVRLKIDWTGDSATRVYDGLITGSRVSEVP